MSRSICSDLARTVRIARYCDAQGVSTMDGIAQLHEAEACTSRREWLKNVGRATAVGFTASVLDACSPPTLAPVHRLIASSSQKGAIDVGIVGAGLAGLTCADTLSGRGVTPAVYEATNRVGGRCFSLRGFFPGQVAERGGEMIENAHKTMLGFAQRFGLTLALHSRHAGETVYFFGSQYISEAEIVNEFREFLVAIRADLHAISRFITAHNHTEADIALDVTDLESYLVTRGASPIVKATVGEAYVAAYGLESGHQSCLNFLTFINRDGGSTSTPFGILGDRRFYIAEGNDAIAQALAAGLPRPIEFEMQLVRVRRTAGGRVELTFESDRNVVVRTHDVVVLAVPFSVLREVELDASLGLSLAKQFAIQHLGYGTHSKMMIGFHSPHWSNLGGKGASYSDLVNHQATWETDPTRATSARATLTDYASGIRGASLNPRKAQDEATKFLADLDLVFPGSNAAATRFADGSILAHLEHWLSNPFARGSRACYRPGEYTTIAGLEGLPEQNLYFAGEHANFYEWQGTMEGAARSGVSVAESILR